MNASFNIARVAALIAAGVISAAGAGAPAPGPLPGAASARAFAQLPLYFEANQGQADAAVSYLARSRGSTFFVMPWGVRMVFTTAAADASSRPAGARALPGRAASESRVVDLRFVGAKAAPALSAHEELAGRVNYFIGSDPQQWHTGLSLHRRVQFREVYDGVNVDFYGAGQQLEYDFSFAPRSDPALAVIEFTGADRIEVSADGELVLHLGGEEIRQPRPVIHQTLRGVRRLVSGGYRQLAPNRIGFEVGEYDHDAPLIIDPVVNYATYLGGGGIDRAWDIKVDGTGAAYIAGETTSANLPATAGAFRVSYSGGAVTNLGDAFVAKLTPEADGLVYLTYLGGSADDAALSLAVDTNGNAYVTGFTDSTNFPVAGALNPGISGKKDKTVNLYPADAFVTKLNSAGSALVYSTFLGGSAVDEGLAIAVDAAGNAYVAGFTDSSNFPTANAVQSVNRGGDEAFVTGLNASGSAYLFSTYLGGSASDIAVGVAVDAAGAVYAAGFTESANFPVTNAFQTHLGGPANVADAFVTKLAPGGTTRVYSTYLGGARDDYAYDVVADAAGNAYVAGWSSSTDFPYTNAPMFLVTNPTPTVTQDAFVSKFGPTGALLNATAFGGTGDDQARSVALDGAGFVHVAGSSTSPLLPVIGATHPQNSTNNGLTDVFVFALATNFTALRHALMIGGGLHDFGYGLDVDAAGNAYLVGRTTSTDFPVSGGLQPVFAGGVADAFIARVLLEPVLTIEILGPNLVFSWPAPAPGFVLQTRPSGFPTWLNVVVTPVLANGRYSVTLPLSASAGLEFFRLFRP